MALAARTDDAARNSQRRRSKWTDPSSAASTVRPTHRPHSPSPGDLAARLRPAADHGQRRRAQPRAYVGVGLARRSACCARSSSTIDQQEEAATSCSPSSARRWGSNRQINASSSATSRAARRPRRRGRSRDDRRRLAWPRRIQGGVPRQRLDHADRRRALPRARRAAGRSTHNPRQYGPASAGTQDPRQHDRVVVLGVTRSVHERQRALPGSAAQLAQLLLLPGQLGRIAAAKLREALRVVSEPAPQLTARRQFARPLVQPAVRSLDAARPQSVDQHPIAVGGRRAFVGALEPNLHHDYGE